MRPSMQANSTRSRKPINRSRVAAGSIWETRMRIDEVKGGIKVFNGSEDNAAGDEEPVKVYSRLRRNQSDATAATDKRKRKSWQPPDIAGPVPKSPIQLRKTRSESHKELKISDGICRGIEKEKTLENAGSSGEKTEVEVEEEMEDDDEEVKSFDDKEIVLDVDKAVVPAEKVKNLDDEKRVTQILEIPSSPDLGKIPVVEIIDHIPMNHAPPVEFDEEVFETRSVAHNGMQNIVDLVMWRDISKSTLVFGFGSFLLVSFSYTKDINFSLISAISYLGLVYLALIFLYKSILHRGDMNVDHDEMNGRELVGEDEAIWLLRIVLPYINEMLLKLRALFCGDPVVTMKLAVLLFVMARCGSSINIWTLAKLGFFGIFTIPKVCSSYSDQMTRYGKFWVERFRDGWESCTHKKAVAAAVFTVVWNVSSTVARVWSVFMLVVAVKLYQQCRADEWSGDGEELGTEEQEEVIVEQRQEDSKPAGGPLRQRQRIGSTATKVNRREVKVKKGM